MRISFSEYIQEAFYDKISSDFENYINSFDIRNLDFDIDEYDEAGDFELIDWEIKRIWAYELDDNKILADVVIEASFEFRDIDAYHNDESEEDSKWFCVSYTTELDKELREIDLIDIGEYVPNSRNDSPLSDALVPIIKKEDMDDIASQILYKFMRTSTAQGFAIDPIEFASSIGLEVITDNVFPNSNIMGEIHFFGDKAGKAYIAPNMPYITGVWMSVNNTVIHECIHWLLHKKAFELSRICNSEYTFSCNADGVVVDGEAVKWMEFQANSLAPRILMPKEIFTKKANELLMHLKSVKSAVETIDVIEELIELLAKEFNVSKTSAKIRLTELGFTEAAGAFNYIDNHYANPHKWKKNCLDDKQTFTIDIENAAYQSLKNNVLKNYLYIDGHFVIDNDKYVSHKNNGRVFLTKYARLHIDECCVVFDLGFDNVPIEYTPQNVLNRDRNAKQNFKFSYVGPVPDSSTEGMAVASIVFHNTKELRKWDNDATSCWKKALKMRSQTQEGLANLIGRSPNAVSDYINQNSSGSKGLFVRMCLGLHLEPAFSSHLMKVCGIAFSTSDIDQLYNFLLNSCFGNDIYENLRIIKEWEEKFK